MDALAMTNIFDSSHPSQPSNERATETAHRKIELQSPADLTYLVANVSQAARERIDRHLPPDAATEGEGGEDAMRRRVEELVDNYIRDTFGAAKDSMTINGMDSKELDAELAKAQEGEEIEPFDTKLAQRILALSSQIENHTLKLADLRRNAPAQTSRRFRDAFERDAERYDARLRRDEEERVEEARKTRVDVGARPERMDEVKETWQRGSGELMALKSALGGTVANMEKARRTVAFLEERDGGQ